MKMIKLITTMSLLCATGIAFGDITTNGSQSSAAAMNLQGQTTAVTTSGNSLQGQAQDANNSQGQSQTAGNNGQSQTAGNNGLSVGGAQPGGSVGAGAGVGNDNSTYINNSKGSDLSRAVGIATAPSLTTTLTETCMGSTSVGAGFSGGSFSFGTTWRDSACVRRLDAREIKSYGDVQAAKEIMCDSDQVRAAFKRVGRPCVEDGGTYTVAATPAPAVIPPLAETPTVVTPAEVQDEQDMIDEKNQAILHKAELARAAMAAKGF